MVTVKCTSPECQNFDLPFLFLGEPDWVECGGCRRILEPTDHQVDPNQEANLE